MKIKPYEITEFDEVIQLLKDTDLYFESCDTRETINAKSVNDPESIAVAVINDQIVGCIFVVSEPWANILYHVAVVPEFQNRGIGSALLKYGEDLIKERGGIQLAGYVMSENINALRWYERKGYKMIPNVTCIYKEI